MSGLKLRGVRKSYGAVEVIKGVDLDIEPHSQNGNGFKEDIFQKKGLTPLSSNQLNHGAGRRSMVNVYHAPRNSPAPE